MNELDLENWAKTIVRLVVTSKSFGLPNRVIIQLNCKSCSAGKDREAERTSRVKRGEPRRGLEGGVAHDLATLPSNIICFIFLS